MGALIAHVVAHPSLFLQHPAPPIAACPTKCLIRPNDASCLSPHLLLSPLCSFHLLASTYEVLLILPVLCVSSAPSRQAATVARSVCPPLYLCSWSPPIQFPVASSSQLPDESLLPCSAHSIPSCSFLLIAYVLLPHRAQRRPFYAMLLLPPAHMMCSFCAIALSAAHLMPCCSSLPITCVPLAPSHVCLQLTYPSCVPSALIAHCRVARVVADPSCVGFAPSVAN
jgi:hypothetical protein